MYWFITKYAWRTLYRTLSVVNAIIRHPNPALVAYSWLMGNVIAGPQQRSKEWWCHWYGVYMSMHSEQALHGINVVTWLLRSVRWGVWFIGCGRCEVCCTDVHMEVGSQWISTGGHWDAIWNGWGCQQLLVQSMGCRYRCHSLSACSRWDVAGHTWVIVAGYVPIWRWLQIDEMEYNPLFGCGQYWDTMRRCVGADSHWDTK